MKIYGLYGKSGTGKSHKAQVLACSLGVHAIIDDGILILNQTHVAGVSAKCEKFLYSATKRAIFYWDGPRNDVKNFIIDAKIADLIILGTSQKMILQILNRLELPLTPEWVNIDSKKPILQ